MSLGRLFLKKWKVSKPKKNQAQVSNKGRKKKKQQVQQALVQAPQQPLARAEPPAAVHRGLTTEDLVRPNTQLRLSIQNFILDQRSPHTQRAYGQDIKRLVKYCLQRIYEKGVEPVDRNLIVAFKDSLLLEKLNQTSVDRHLATFRSFFTWLVEDGFLTKSPAETVRFMKPKRLSRTNGFTDDEVLRVLSQPNIHSKTGALHYAVLCVLFYCGVRRSELSSLRTKDFFTERGMKVIRLTGKGNVERLLPLQPRVVQAIDHYLHISRRKLEEDRPLFLPIKNNRTGVKEKGIDPTLIYYIVKKYSKEAGIRNRVSPHSCRATAISNARDRNAPDRAIQEFAGWASPDMITRYDKRKTSLEKSAALVIQYQDLADKSD